MRGARILLIPSPFAYVNPTWELLVKRLISHHGAIAVGPYTKTSCQSLAALKRVYGSFDCVICDPWFFFASGDIPDHYRPRDLGQCGIPLIVNLMQYDLHSLPEDFISAIKARSALAISAATSPQFRMVARHAEQWLVPGAYTNVRADAIDDHFALVPHCVAPDEFIERRKHYDASIMGANYPFRRRVAAYLKDQGFKTTTGGRLQKVIGALATYHPFGSRLWPINRPLGMGYYRRRYREKLAASMISVACDGGVGYPVRKFFEIPAAGSVLVGQFFPEPAALGFIDRETAYMVGDDDMGLLHEIITMSRAGAAETERVRKAGRDMVKDLHSVAVRAAQVCDLAARVGSGQRLTTRWINGQQSIVSRNTKTAQNANRPPTG